jgi:hypothetical protein
MEVERNWMRGRRRPTPRERSSFLSFYFQHRGWEGLGERQKEANTQGEVVIPAILFSARVRRGIRWGTGGGQHPGRGHHSCHFIFSMEAEMDWGKGRRRPTP